MARRAGRGEHGEHGARLVLRLAAGRSDHGGRGRRYLAAVAARLPVVDWLGRALDRGRQTPTASLVDTIDRVQHQLAWRYGYDRVPRSLQGKYAFAELMGPKGPVVSERLILGLVLLTPGCTYPSHAHDGITESYICLSGTLSENDVGVYAPGSLLYNPPNHRHRLTTGDHEPVLLAYAWSGAPERLLKQGFTG